MANKKRKLKLAQLKSNQGEKMTDEIEMSYGFICMVDALGTKGIWAQVKPSDYSKKLNELYKYFKRRIEEDNKENIIHFDIKTFSDTFFITAKFNNRELTKDNEYNNKAFVLYLSKLLSDFFIQALSFGIFYRGSISQGYFYEDEYFIIGPAVDDAAEFFESGNWIGIIATPSTSLLIDSIIAIVPDLKFKHGFIKYSVPLSNGKLLETNVVNWPQYQKDFFSEREVKMDIKGWFCVNCSKYPIPLSVFDKYLNTLKFIDHCLSNKNSIDQLSNPALQNTEDEKPENPLP